MLGNKAYCKLFNLSLVQSVSCGVMVSKLDWEVITIEFEFHQLPHTTNPELKFGKAQ